MLRSVYISPIKIHIPCSGSGRQIMVWEYRNENKNTDVQIYMCVTSQAHIALIQTHTHIAEYAPPTHTHPEVRMKHSDHQTAMASDSKQVGISDALCSHSKRDAWSEICCCSHFPLTRLSPPSHLSFIFLPDEQ